MSNLSNNQCLQIVTLKQHTSKSICEITEALNVEKSAVGKMLKSYGDTGFHES